MYHRSVNLTVLLCLAVIVLSSGLSAAVAQEEGGEQGEGESEPQKAEMELAQLRSEADAANHEYNEALSEEERLANEVAKARNDLAAAEKSLEEAQGRFDDRAAQMYKHGQVGFMGVLLDAANPADFSNRLTFLTRLLGKGRDDVQEWRASRDQLEQTKGELEDQLQSWKDAHEETTVKKENAQASLDETQAFYYSLADETRREIEEERASETESALRHVEGLLQKAPQKDPKREEEASDEPVEVEQARQIQVASALTEAIKEWTAHKEAQLKGFEGAAKKPTAIDEAQNQARQAAEQVAREQAAKEEAAARAQEAEKAKIAAQRAPAAKQAEAQAAAKEAERQSRLAAERAAKEQAAAEQAAAQAAKPSSGASSSGVLGEAKTYLDTPYVLEGPCARGVGVDCSCFTMLVFRKFGIELPDSPEGQWGMGSPVQGPPKAGDLVFWSEDGSGKATHVGIANGDGTATHASNYTGDVTVTPISAIPGYMGARRLI
jgi:cell wall-associated NlpC family hydrolase